MFDLSTVSESLSGLRYLKAQHSHSIDPEKPKVVLSKSTHDIARRCAIHVFPIATTVTVLVVNYRGLYIGQDFSGPVKSETLNLLFLQLLSKLHELLIVASLTVIVYSASRYELLFGDGVPLGLLGSGLSFTSIEYFFSKAFFAGARRWLKQKRKVQKIAFLALLLVSGFIATTAGPSSATLLVPKSQPFPGGSTDYYLPASTDSFWSIDLLNEQGDL